MIKLLSLLEIRINTPSTLKQLVDNNLKDFYDKLFSRNWKNIYKFEDIEYDFEDGYLVLNSTSDDRIYVKDAPFTDEELKKEFGMSQKNVDIQNVLGKRLYYIEI
jgi:hypothetical protein